MIRRAFLRRLGLGAAAVVISPLDAFELPEIEPWRFTATQALEDLEVVHHDLSDLAGLIHDIYLKEIVPSLQQVSPLTKIFEDVEDHYALHGERIEFAVNVQ